jgi:hypothetical protein
VPVRAFSQANESTILRLNVARSVSDASLTDSKPALKEAVMSVLADHESSRLSKKTSRGA